MEGLILYLAVLGGLAVAGVVAGLVIKSKVQKFSMKAFGTKSIFEGYNEQKKKLSETPRSLHSMTHIYLPEIHKDFPEFDYELYKNKANAVLRGYFNAISTGTTATLPEEISLTLKNHILEIIEGLNTNGQKQYFVEPVLHNTQLSRYIKTGTTVTVLFSISVGLYSYIEDENGKVIHGDKNLKHQTVYEVGLVYVQDADKMGVHNEALGLNCPNCGAPIKNLGQKFCDYCGTGVIEVNTRVWKFDSIKEQTNRKTAY